MIYFYRPKQCAFCDEVESRLNHLVLAHRIHETDREDAFGIDTVLVEGKRRYETREEILAFLDEITGELILQREMQSDSCIIDPQTGRGCL